MYDKEAAFGKMDSILENSYFDSMVVSLVLDSLLDNGEILKYTAYIPADDNWTINISHEGENLKVYCMPYYVFEIDGDRYNSSDFPERTIHSENQLVTGKFDNFKDYAFSFGGNTKRNYELLRNMMTDNLADSSSSLLQQLLNNLRNDVKSLEDYLLNEEKVSN